LIAFAEIVEMAKFGWLLGLVALWVAEAPAAPPPSTLVHTSARASEIDSRAGEHPELGFVFSAADGKPLDVQHALVDTAVESRGELVIWLMAYNDDLLPRLTGYGLHVVQPHYANGWFGKIDPVRRDDGHTLGDIRLAAAIGGEQSDLVTIPRVDSAAERSIQFVKWLAEHDASGGWQQFLTADRTDLLWDKVILAGTSHGSTTAARWAKQQRVARVVMFAGPRDQYESWQGLESATPRERFFGFSHVLDGGWTGKHYCRSWQMLGLAEFGPLVDVDMTQPPYGNSRRLITKVDVANNADRAHSIVTRGDQWDDVWRYLFTHPVDRTGKAVALDPDCVVQPPPAERKPRAD
jgi:hypothetical protein